MNKVRIEKGWSPLRMNRYTVFWMMVTGALGWGLGQAGHEPAKPIATTAQAGGPSNAFQRMFQAESPAPASKEEPSQADASPATPSGLLRRAVLEFNPRTQPPNDYNDLVTQARGNPTLRREILQRFESVTDKEVRSRLAMLMTHVGTPDIKDYADTLSTSQDPAKRMDGYRILAQLDVTRFNPEVRQQLVHALDKETQPEALTALLLGMSPGEVRPPQEVGAVVEKLTELSRNPAVSVRAAAVSAMARWGEGQQMEDVLVSSLADPSGDVATAAIYAAGQAGIRTPAVKNALFRLASQSSGDAAARRAAASALSQYNLAPQEFDKVMRLRQELDEGGRSM